jgi:hypothetical protein
MNVEALRLIQLVVKDIKIYIRRRASPANIKASNIEQHQKFIMASATDLEILIESIGAKNVFVRGFGFYENEVVQYATTSYPANRTSPAVIVKPKNREDIASTLDYAKKQGVAVAIRTGGHQYSGASSATAPNIQLDLSETFQGPDDRTLLRKQGLLRTSVSWSLKEFSAYMSKNKIFVPHGQCIAVHLGGHVQTGGYGQRKCLAKISGSSSFFDVS